MIDSFVKVDNGRGGGDIVAEEPEEELAFLGVGVPLAFAMVLVRDWRGIG